MHEDNKLQEESRRVDEANRRSWKAEGRAGTALALAIVALTVSLGTLGVALVILASERSAPRVASHPPAQFAAAPQPQPWGGWSPPEVFPFPAQAPAPLAVAAAPAPAPAPAPLAAAPAPAPLAALPEPVAASLPTAADIARATDEAYAQAQAMLRANQTGQLSVNQILNDPDSAGPILDVLAQATSIHMPLSAPDGAAEEDGAEAPVVYAFFDPRCPYCHQAILGLDGAVNIRWLPVLTLGAGGETVTRQIAGQMLIEKNEDGEMVRVRFEEDGARLARLRLVGAGQNTRLPTMEPDEEQLAAVSFLVNENLGVLMELYGPQRNMLAVPTFFVPRADGSAVVLRGYSAETKTQILQEMRRGG